MLRKQISTILTTAALLFAAADVNATDNPSEQFRKFFEAYCGAERASFMDELAFTAPDDLSQLADMTADDLFEYNQTLSHVPLDRDADEVFGEHPITLILLPGIFGEFIPLRPFEEILFKGGKFAETYQPKLDRELARVFVLPEEVHYFKRLSEVVDLASYDRDGRSLVNLAFFKPRIEHNGKQVYTMETLGATKDNVKYYYDRLTRLMSTLEPKDKESVYIVGYSRGTVVGLELLRTIGEKRPEWASSIRGLVSLAGVYWGTETADAVVPGPWLKEHLANPELYLEDPTESVRHFSEACKEIAEETMNPNQKLFCGLANRSRVDQLSINPETVKDFFSSVRNLTSEFLAATSLPKMEAEAYTGENSVDEGVDLNVFGYFGLFARYLSEWVEATEQAKTMTQNLPVNERFLRRFHMLLAHVYAGTASLTVESQEQWLAQSGEDLPEWVKLYSIVGTMPDAAITNSDNTLSLSTAYGFEGYGYDTYDFRYVLRGAYYDLLDVDPTPINDSQVSVSSSVFQLGAQRAGFFPSIGDREQVIAVLGTHHWGLAFPTAFPDKQHNTFPRDALFKAIGAYLAFDER